MRSAFLVTGSNGYFDIYYQIMFDFSINDFGVSGQLLEVEALGIGGNVVSFDLEEGGDHEGQYTGLLPAVYLEAINFSGIELKFSIRFVTGIEHGVGLLFTIKPVAEHRLTYSWVKLYNVCDKDTA